MDHMEKVKELRARTDRHINCAQAVLMTYSEEAGMTDEQALALCENFGTGMRRASVCGAVTGGLMALGLLGKGEETAREFQKRFKERCQYMDCGDLLRKAHEEGEARKPHCDRMVYTAVELIEELI